MGNSAPLRVGFIGAGRVASVLAPALRDAGYAVTAVASRTRASAERLAAAVPGCNAVTAQDVVQRAEVVFITTLDGAIAEVAGALRWTPERMAVHCSGALTLAPLQSAARQGAPCGSFHPIQTFAPGGGAATLQGVHVGIEADAGARDVLWAMAGRLGATPLDVPAVARPLYHAAAVLSCGYVVTLLADALRLWRAAGLPEAEGAQALAMLARSTLDHAAAVGHARALTGPVARGDVETVAVHLTAIAQAVPEVLGLYAEVGLRSAALALTAGAAPPQGGWAPVFATHAGAARARREG